jgi:hypothetical protein
VAKRDLRQPARAVRTSLPLSAHSFVPSARCSAVAGFFLCLPLPLRELKEVARAMEDTGR